ncbi:Cytochrome-c oxidase [Sulfidibacter corallicola]|uniref:cytochrome-c oxidase n=1 Tax=Sulfidibacter corallicola TaxID=2818388 RepID=A0A8A4TH18_SULCO|nr:hypothetical protein [Sulfidibacter corallicola]QTD48504.1 hypothetical protein J3U87_23235 [Sulfidibacter corallicola]
MVDWLGMTENASAHGGRIDDLMVIIHILMFVLLVGWGLFFVIALLKFRSSKQKSADYKGVKSKASKYLEIAVAAFEGVLLIGFSIPIWSERVDAFPSTTEAITVRVVAEQFAWNMHYPGADNVFGKTSVELINAETNPLGLDRDDPDAKDDIVTVNQLHLPVNKPAIIYLSSKDVIHCLNLPEMRVKQDAIPGMVIPVWFTPIKTVKSEIACAQLCGLGHYRMKGFYTVETQAEFDAWMQKQIELLQEEEESDDFWDE